MTRPTIVKTIPVTLTLKVDTLPLVLSCPLWVGETEVCPFFNIACNGMTRLRIMKAIPVHPSLDVDTLPLVLCCPLWVGKAEVCPFFNIACNGVTKDSGNNLPTSHTQNGQLAISPLLPSVSLESCCLSIL